MIEKKLMSDEEIYKDLCEAEKDFSEMCLAAAYYLNSNGMPLDAVRELLQSTLDRQISLIDKGDLN